MRHHLTGKDQRMSAEAQALTSMKPGIEYHQYRALNQFTATLAALYTASVLLTDMMEVGWRSPLSAISRLPGAVLEGIWHILLQWGLALPMLLSETRHLIALDELGGYLLLVALQLSAAYFGARLARLKNRSVPNWAVAGFFLPWLSPFILVKLPERPRKSLAIYGYSDGEGDEEKSEPNEQAG